MTPHIIDTLQTIAQSLRVVESQYSALEAMERQHPWLALLGVGREELRAAILSLDDLIETDGDSHD
jgi:hypothetical protein